MGTTRERLIEATKALVWERGIEATSPGAILKASGAGQGSLYHHFSGKPELVATATAALAADLQAETEALFDAEVPALDKVFSYLAKHREALRGCRLGRLAFDPARDAEASAPIQIYFTGLQETLTSLLHKAISDGALSENLDARDIAMAITSCVQGGYVLAAIAGTADAMTHALDGITQLLQYAAN